LVRLFSSSFIFLLGKVGSHAPISAYNTNPSEASFRQHLTEQSFRHHLYRLDDPSDRERATEKLDDFEHHKHVNGNEPSHRSTYNSSSSASAPAAPAPQRVPVHFSSRAAVALRTPKHDFHSFGFFTIAAVLPGNTRQLPRSNSSLSLAGTVNTTSAITGEFSKGSWFIGAFGRWWRGGLVDAPWPHPLHRKSKPSLNRNNHTSVNSNDGIIELDDADAHSSADVDDDDDDAWSSGIISAKAIDKFDKHDGEYSISLASVRFFSDFSWGINFGRAFISKYTASPPTHYGRLFLFGGGMSMELSACVEPHFYMRLPYDFGAGILPQWLRL
jgi:hypothetical protein